jgi:carboxylesterase type B
MVRNVFILLRNVLTLEPGITFFDDYDTRSANGQFLKVPFFVGNNANEGDIFAVIAEEEAFNFTIPVATEVLSDLITAVRRVIEALGLA